MRNKLLLILIFSFICKVSAAQEILLNERFQGFYKFCKSYFRSDPFATNFSGFINHLINDPSIQGKVTQTKTDSTLYSFFGTYSSYNPFFFTPKRVEILLEEKEVQYDSTKKDTLFIYQLLAYANDDAMGESDIRKEFEKIHHQNNKKFDTSNYNEVKDGDSIRIAMHNYFISYYALAPLSIIRGRLKDQHEWVLNITLRFKMSANEAVLVRMPYGTK